MTSKEEDIVHILIQMRERGITLDELAQSADKIPAAIATPLRNNSDVAMKVFSYLGAIFVLAGICTYITMFWGSMSSFMRIFVTLGTGFGLSILSVITMKEGRYPKIIMPLVLAAACVETTGWFVFINEMFPQGNDIHKAATVVFGIMAFQQAMIFNTFRRTDVLFTVIIFAYGFFSESLEMLSLREEYIGLLLGGCLVYTSQVISKSPYRILSSLGYMAGACWFNAGLYVYMTHNFSDNTAAMVTGISFCSLSYGLRKAKGSRLSELGFLVGSTIFYGGLFDWVHHTSFELLYLAVAVVMLYGSALLQSGALLLTSAVAILCFIGYYSSEYFANSVGWPVALILMGVAFFGVSATAVKIKRKFQL